MRLNKLIKILTFVLCISTSVLFAQTVPTLEDAVRDQYVNVIDEHELNEIASSESLSGLDEYSHFLSEKELVDVSNNRNTEAFVRLLSKHVLYIRIPIFHAKTSMQVHKAIELAKSKNDLLQVIVDLRDNRGGLLNAAVEVADEFVTRGTIAATKGRVDIANLVFLAKPNGILEGKKVAVLINKNTASAAELLAGVLKNNANSCILGQNSFGKSAVQTQIPLSNGGAISLTTAIYYFANGKTVNKQGIKPDIEISTWQLWRNPPYTIDQAPSIQWLQNPIIEKSIHCLSSK